MGHQFVRQVHCHLGRLELAEGLGSETAALSFALWYNYLGCMRELRSED